MGSGDWLKIIINLNKLKKQKSKKIKNSPIPVSNGFILEPQPQEESRKTVNDVTDQNAKFLGGVQEMAAIRIQTAIRAFMAKKILRNLKGLTRLQTLTEGDFGEKQTLNTLSHLHSWSKTQACIRTRRLRMVEQGEIRQKKFENRLKLEAKLRDLEIEWSGGSHTMDEALARIQQREEAAVKRERAMAYAFSHQWRASSKSNFDLKDSELATANWGWSWMERWIAAQPWESRIVAGSTPKKVNSPAIKMRKNLKSPSIKQSKSPKTSPNGKKNVKNRKLSYGKTIKVGDEKNKIETLAIE